MMNNILSDMFQHFENTAVGTLHSEDGKSNISAIRKSAIAIDDQPCCSDC